MGGNKIARIAAKGLFNLIRGPGMVDLGEAVLDAVLPAAHREHVGDEAGGWPVGVARREAELDAVVGQYRVNPVGDGGDQGDEEGGGRDAVALSTSCTTANLSVATKRQRGCQPGHSAAGDGDVDWLHARL